MRLIGLVLFVYVLSKVHWSEFFRILREINPGYFFLGILLTIPALCLRALRWRELVLAVESRISPREAILIFAKALFWGVVTPGKIGELSRAKYLSQKNRLVLDKALFTVIFDKLTEFFFIAFLCFLALWALFYLFEVDLLWLGIILILLMSGTVYFLIKKERSLKLLRIFFRIFVFNSLRERAEAFFNGFFEQTRRVSRALMVKLFFYETAVYLLMFLVFFFMARSLGINAPVWYLALMIPPIIIIAALPISVLGLGTREAAFIFFFSLIDLNLNQAVAFSFLIMVWSLASALPGLILIYGYSSSSKTG